MHATLFILCLACLMLIPAIWGVRNLPSEKFQMLAALPLRMEKDGVWTGLNLTWYGFFTATAYTFGTALGLILLESAGIPLFLSAFAACILLGICIPASRWIAGWVEGKAHTFTVGGASFLGILLTPWVLLLTDTLGQRFGHAPLPLIPAWAALAIAYASGEGMGRLACLSFGCCYGKPLSALSPSLARFFRPMALVFTGKTKKISYASGLDGQPVAPVQALTLFLYTFLCLGGLALFLIDQAAMALVLCLGGTQIWRVISEFFRADHRGERRFSAYQTMALLTLPYALACLFLPPFSQSLFFTPDLKTGLALLGRAQVLAGLFFLWAFTFFYTGRSTVTGSTICFFVHQDRV